MQFTSTSNDMFSVSAIQGCTDLSDLVSHFRHSTSLGDSDAFLTSTATWTTGETENFIIIMLCAVLDVVRVPLEKELIDAN
jgi:hypothetical protein